MGTYRQRLRRRTYREPPADVYAGAPGLADVLTAQGVTLEALSELTGYPLDYLRRMRDEGQTAPRIVTSRISAVLGVETDAIRGEQHITRIADTVIPE